MAVASVNKGVFEMEKSQELGLSIADKLR